MSYISNSWTLIQMNYIYIYIYIYIYYPRDIRNRTTAGHSKLLDSTICEHLNALNSCVVNYNHECFDVLHRARTKQHLIVLEALYILFYRSILSKQNSKHSLNLLGENFANSGWFLIFFFSSLGLTIILTFTPLLIHLIYIVF